MNESKKYLIIQISGGEKSFKDINVYEDDIIDFNLNHWAAEWLESFSEECAVKSINSYIRYPDEDDYNMIKDMIEDEFNIIKVYELEVIYDDMLNKRYDEKFVATLYILST